MRQLNQWAVRCGRAMRAVAVAVDPGEDAETADDRAVLESLDQELRRDFARASHGLTQARQRQRAKDTPMHRSAVAQGVARIDAVLDMYLLHLEIQGTTGRTAVR